MIAFDRDRIPYALHGSSTSDIIEQTYRMPDAVYSMSAERMEIFKQYYCMTRKLLSLDASKKVQKNIIQGFSYVVMGIVDGWGSAERDSIYKANAREERLVTSFLSDIRKFALQQREVSFYAGRAELAPSMEARGVRISWEMALSRLEYIFSLSISSRSCSCFLICVVRALIRMLTISITTIVRG